ncbi:MAG TPA: signal peptidase I, partial [Dehalococcoidia bacterium]|nr:signal peptidase I [Dehalococcoidia bacterium]
PYLRQILVTILIFLIVFTGLRFTLQSFLVHDICMEPSFTGGQYLLVNKLTYHFHSPQRGDVVILWPPKSSNYPFIKRVIGLPGEEIKIEDGEVYIRQGNDFKLLEEPSYIAQADYSGHWIIPEDEYFVLGDNRNVADDSHRWGTVPGGNIIGKVWLCYWPPGEWGLSPRYSVAME